MLQPNLARTPPALGVAFALALALGGCGGGGQTAPTAPTAPTAGANPLPATATISSSSSGTAPVVGGASAACAALTSAQIRSHSRLIVIGTFLPGASVTTGGAQLLTSPARFRVDRYLKGHGPRVLSIVTGIQKRATGVAISEDGITPRAGERWQIMSSSPGVPVSASMCWGSRRLRTTPHTPS